MHFRRHFSFLENPKRVAEIITQKIMIKKSILTNLNYNISRNLLAFSSKKILVAIKTELITENTIKE